MSRNNSKVLFEDGDVLVEASYYEKNRRYDVPMGTKCIQVTKGFRPRSTSPVAAMESALDEAWNAAEREYGEFRHEQVEIAVIFVTCKVLVEFRVRPD